MFCNKCGKELKDGVVFCTSCGTPVPHLENEKKEAEQSVFVDTPAQSVSTQPESAQEIPVQEVNTQTYYQEPVAPAFEIKEEPVRREKLSKSKIAIIAIAAVVLVAALFVWLNFDSIEGYFLRSRSPEEIMKTVEKEEIGQLADSFSSAYGSIIDTYSGQPVGNVSNIRFRLSEDVTDTLESTLAAQGLDVDLSFLENINLAVNYDTFNNLYKLSVGFEMSDVRILTMDVIADMDNMIVWVGFPELSSVYAKMDLGNMYDFDEEALESIAILESLRGYLPSAEVVNNLLNKYVAIVLDQITMVERSEGPLQTNGISMTATCLKATIDEKTVINMALAVMKEARNDGQIKAIIDDMAVFYAEAAGMYYDDQMTDVYSAFQASIDEVIDNLTEQLDDCGEEALYYYSYLDNDNNVIGRRFTLSDNSVDMYYYTVYSGNQHAFIADLDTVKITGSGTKNGNLTSGTYVLSVNGADMIQIEITDLDETRLSKGEVCGSFTLSFTSEFSEMVEYTSGDAYTASIISMLSIRVDVDSTELYGKYDICLLSGGMELCSLGLDSKKVDSSIIVTPDSFVDYEDEDSITYWVSGMDIQKLLDNLEEAGISEDLLMNLFSSMS